MARTKLREAQDPLHDRTNAGTNPIRQKPGPGDRRSGPSLERAPWSRPASKQQPSEVAQLARPGPGQHISHELFVSLCFD